MSAEMSTHQASMSVESNRETATADLMLLRSTIDRLKQQRSQVERLKWESRQKDTQIESLRAECARLNKEVADMARVRSENTRLQSKITAQDRQIALLHDELKTSHSELSSSLASQKAAEEAFRDASTSREQANAVMLADLKDKMAGVLQQLEQAKAHAARSEHAAHLNETQLASARAELASARRHHDEEQRKAAEAAQAMHERQVALSKGKGELEAQLRFASCTVQELQVTTRTQQNKIQELQNMCQLLKGDRSSCEESIHRMQRQLANSQAAHVQEKGALAHDLDEAMALIQSKDEVLQKQDTSIAELRGLLKKQQRTCQELEGTALKLSDQLSASRESEAKVKAEHVQAQAHIADLEQLYEAAQAEVNRLTERYDAVCAEVDRERVERQSFARARLNLLNQVTAEENLLQRALDSGYGSPERGTSPAMHWTPPGSPARF